MDGYLILESNSNFLLFFSISHYSPWVMALIDETVKTPFMLAWPFFSHSQDLPAGRPNARSHLGQALALQRVACSSLTVL